MSNLLESNYIQKKRESGSFSLNCTETKMEELNLARFRLNVDQSVGWFGQKVGATADNWRLQKRRQETNITQLFCTALARH